MFLQWVNLKATHPHRVSTIENNTNNNTTKIISQLPASQLSVPFLLSACQDSSLHSGASVPHTHSAVIPSRIDHMWLWPEAHNPCLKLMGSPALEDTTHTSSSSTSSSSSCFFIDHHTHTPKRVTHCHDWLATQHKRSLPHTYTGSLFSPGIYS